MSGGAESSINEIFKAFVHNFALAFKEEFLKPHCGEKLDRAMDVYARLGYQWIMDLWYKLKLMLESVLTDMEALTKLIASY